VKPLLHQDAEEPITLLEAREQIDQVGRKLDKLGMDYHISPQLDGDIDTDRTQASSNPPSPHS
jgi:hypothetical protein